jgi:hypothetical protein
VARDRCYDLKNIIAEKFGENIDVFDQTAATFCKKIDHNIVFLRKTPIFSLKNWQKSQKL